MEAVESDRTENGVKVRVVSFSYRCGIQADTWGNGGGFVFDCRGVPNPCWGEDLRNHSGAEPEVRAFFEGHREAVEAFALAAEAWVLQTVRAYQADGRRRLGKTVGGSGLCHAARAGRNLPTGHGAHTARTAGAVEEGGGGEVKGEAAGRMPQKSLRRARRPGGAGWGSRWSRTPHGAKWRERRGAPLSDAGEGGEWSVGACSRLFG